MNLAMAFSELERKRFERAFGAFIEKRRPPPPICPKLDLEVRLSTVIGMS